VLGLEVLDVGRRVVLLDIRHALWRQSRDMDSIALLGDGWLVARVHSRHAALELFVCSSGGAHPEGSISPARY